MADATIVCRRLHQVVPCGTKAGYIDLIFVYVAAASPRNLVEVGHLLDGPENLVELYRLLEFLRLDLIEIVQRKLELGSITSRYRNANEDGGMSSPLPQTRGEHSKAGNRTSID